MKEIKIKNLSLTNWKAHTCSYDFGQSNTITGYNGSGKTLLFKAWCWLLTGRSDPFTSPNHELYDNREELSRDTPKASVKAVVAIDGMEVTIERVAECKWIRARGSEEYEKASSDTYAFLVDGIEVPATQFKNLIQSYFAQADLLPCCVSGEFFTYLVETDKDKAQKVLSQIIGEISDEDYGEEFADICKSLKSWTMEQLKQKASTEKRAAKNVVDTIPTIIDSKQADLAKFEAINWDAIQDKLKQKQTEYDTIDAKIRYATDSVKQLSEARNMAIRKADECKIALDSQKRIFDADVSHDIALLANEVKKAREENQAREMRNQIARRKYDMLFADRAQVQSFINQRDATRQDYLAKKDNIKAMEFDASSALCPVCGAVLTGENLEKAEETFNQHKMEEYNRIVTLGKENTEALNKLREQLAEIDAKITDGFKPEELLDVEEMQKCYEAAESTKPRFEDTMQYDTLKRAIDAAEAAIPQAIDIPDMTGMLAERKAIMAEIMAINQTLGTKNIIGTLNDELDNLKETLRINANKIAQIEGYEAKLEAYEQKQADIIKHRVNDCLEHSSIATRKQQKNGTWVPTCEITDRKGVKYSTLNGAARALAMIDMQTLFCDRLGIRMPVFIDECNIFDNAHIPALDAQMFYIFADDRPLAVMSK